MLNDDEWTTLLDTLVARTKGGDPKWQKRPEATFELELGSNDKLQLHSVDGDGNAPYELVVLHKDPWVTTFDVFAVLSSEDAPSWVATKDRLAELYTLVTRQVSGVSTVFKGLLDALGGPVEQAPKPSKNDEPWGEPSKQDGPWGESAPY